MRTLGALTAHEVSGMGKFPVSVRPTRSRGSELQARLARQQIVGIATHQLPAQLGDGVALDPPDPLGGEL